MLNRLISSATQKLQFQNQKPLAWPENMEWNTLRLGKSLKYFNLIFKSALGETSVAPVYDYVFSTIVNSIPNPPTPSQLMGKGIILGKRLINSTKYQLVRKVFSIVNILGFM